MKNTGEYRIETFPLSRLSTIDIGIAGKKKHHMMAFIELDVTEARRKLRETKNRSEKKSFSTWLIKCISHACEECKQIHSARKGKRKVVIFEDVDISIMIEREIKGKKVQANS